jgi:radical SAM superfamily enzyme YgiQ (UPF0313 family)
MSIYLVNPSDISFGTAVITPRWLYVLAAATPAVYGDPLIVDETLESLDFDRIQAGDVVGIGIHTSNALRGYKIGQEARKRGAKVVFGGIHATLYPDEALELGGAHSVVKGDGDMVWGQVLKACLDGVYMPIYDGGRVGADSFRPARWDLLPPDSYMWASVQTVRGCPKHCSFCSVWRTDGQEPRQRGVEAVVQEVVELRRKGFRFIALADDNFYPVSLQDLEMAGRREDKTNLLKLQALRAERFELMDRLAQLPKDLNFYTQITMEAAEDTEFLDAMSRAHIRGALVGVESVTEAGLKDVFKGFNLHGEALVTRLRVFKEHGIHVLGSFIFGLPSDRAETFDATAALANRADVTFAQFVTLTPFPGTVDFMKWEKEIASKAPLINGRSISRYWLIPQGERPKIFSPHPTLSAEEIRVGTQAVWDRFYSVPQVWARSRVVKSLRNRLAFLLLSKLYRQMYANTGISTDSARVARSTRWARLLARPARRLFVARPMPELQVPT